MDGSEEIREGMLSLGSRKMFNFFVRKDIRKILKRKDSDAGQKGNCFKMFFWFCPIILASLGFLPCFADRVYVFFASFYVYHAIQLAL